MGCRFVSTLFGRRIFLPGIHDADSVKRSAAQRAAINAPVQGAAADVIKRAMVAVDDWLAAEHLPAHMVMQVPTPGVCEL